MDAAQLLLAGPLPCTWMGLDGTILAINDQGARNLGAPASDLNGQSIHDVLPDMSDTLKKRFADVAASEGSLSFLDEIELPDGSLRVFESHDAPIRDAEGRCVGVVVVSTDVTARTRAERRLAEAERRFELAMDVVRDGVWDWNVATGDFDMSPGFFALVGYTEEELEVGRTEWFFSVLHPDDRARVRRLLEAHFAGETSEYVAEYRWQHRNGTWRWALARGRVVERGEDGSPVRMIGTTIDVTDRHELEARLLAAEKMEAIGRLAGGVAHDFNNLLTAVMGHLEFLSAYDLPSGAREDLGHIDAAVQQASRLTTQLLSFARRRMVRPRAVAPNRLLRDVKDLVDGLLGADVALILELADDVPDVFIDPAQLEQIVVNLALNARDAMPEGGQLTVATSVASLAADPAYSELTEGRYVALSVSDTGTGIEPGTLKHVFEPFFTTKPAGEGTGLGLASCYGIVRQAGGRIDVRSEVGQGTTFVVYLPVAARSPDDASSGRRTVLVVEDDDLVRSTAVRGLELAGFRVLQAASGDQALALEPSFGSVIDLLVTDVVMPGMTGRTLASELQARQPTLEVLFVSGYAHDASVRNGLLAEDVAFLPKPFAPSVLVRRVRQILGEEC